MSIDFSKAFNRVDHLTCLNALTLHGASTDTIGMVSFLTNRRMIFKVNNSYSSERAVKGGSPQGTKLGNLLFILTIDNIEDVWPTSLLGGPQDGLPSSPDNDNISMCSDFLGLRGLAGRIGALRRFDSGVQISSIPHKTNEMASVLRYGDESGRDLSRSLLASNCPDDKSNPVWHEKYVDDVNEAEIQSMATATLLLSQQRPFV